MDVELTSHCGRCHACGEERRRGRDGPAMLRQHIIQVEMYLCSSAPPQE